VGDGLRDSDEHATSKGARQALKNKRLFIGTTLLQGTHAPKKNSSRRSRISKALENLKINAF
jgi:hypothetical protein